MGAILELPGYKNQKEIKILKKKEKLILFRKILENNFLINTARTKTRKKYKVKKR